MTEEVKETKKRGRPAAKKQKTEETNAPSEEVKLEVKLSEASEEDKVVKQEKAATPDKAAKEDKVEKVAKEVKVEKVAKKAKVEKEDKAAKEDQSSSGDESAEDVYEVESVHGRRIHNGKLQYFLKWKGYPASQNSWEDEDNIFSKDLLQKYDEKEKQKAANKAARKGTGKGGRRRPEAAQDVEQNVTVVKPKVGFEYGDQIEEIKGARMKTGELELCCKWIGKTETSFVLASVANVRVPQLVIKFYESRVRFENPDDQEAKVATPKAPAKPSSSSPASSTDKTE
eukprot:TRINITY_DN1560_c0_g1_i3.p1 TRINITY_DN1560_c0_g1~~TRINITY_DN1560_c0_g1_i3.p1  ORF type:complete len:285 (+),score=69.04 TRINITY_DN1560_c0_g1_i3:140-994(+)